MRPLSSFLVSNINLRHYPCTSAATAAPVEAEAKSPLLSFFDPKQILAGLTVSLAMVPESLAFTFVAGVPPLVGLHAASIMARRRRCRLNNIRLDNIRLAPRVEKRSCFNSL